MQKQVKQTQKLNKFYKYMDNYEFQYKENREKLALMKRRDLVGSLGALDFLIKNEIQLKKHFSSSSKQLKSPIVSYCIPLMGRLSDIQETLQYNLTQHHDMSVVVEFVVILFNDFDGVSFEWITKNFSNHIKNGLLKIINSYDLDSWHFGKAKNAFVGNINGSIYSSLDGDNFVTRHETFRLLEINRKYRNHFLLHHFSGKWGDGTSGRVSVPSSIYSRIKYDPLLLPRQFDEIDFMIRALREDPTLPFLCVDINSHMFVKSKFANDIYTQEELKNDIIQIKEYERKLPANPKGSNYVEALPYLEQFGRINATLCALSGKIDSQYQNLLENRLQDSKQKLIELLPIKNALDIFFYKQKKETILSKHKFCVFLVVKDEDIFLQDLVKHYENLGVTDFFIIDDNSKTPVQNVLRQNNVHVFVPKIGRFKNFKTIWIEVLINYFLDTNDWYLTIDADEFIELPSKYKSFLDLTKHLDEIGKIFMPGLLVDLVPNPSINLNDIKNNYKNYLTHFLQLKTPVSKEYENISSIKWAFGPYADISWKHDIRYHLYQTIDCLRKIPLVKHTKFRHLHQGFHTLYINDHKCKVSDKIWGDDYLIIYHYKFAKQFDESLRLQSKLLASNYFDRTEKNILKSLETTPDQLMAKIKILQNQLVSKVKDM
ncbi:glycosyltransferase family 2 protein [Orrella sp. 11846]|uniref:glycosyltransferase family 2 protein n=1 Tax=Orrella sp. 11846 TaxID=3409913 RepID=UPI003B59266A